MALTPTPLLYANTIIPNPHVSAVIRAMQATSLTARPSPAPPRVIEIDSSDESPSPLAVPTSPRPLASRNRQQRQQHVVVIDTSDEDNPPVASRNGQRRPQRVVVIGTSDESDPPANFWPTSSTHWVEVDNEKRDQMASAMTRASKRAVGKDRKERREGKARASTGSTSYPDDGTLDLIANLTIGDDNGNVVAEEREEATSSQIKRYAVTSSTTVLPADSWIAAGHFSQVLPHGKAKRLHRGRDTKPDYEVYVVFAGLQPGIYTSWSTAKRQVNRVKGNNYKGYPTRQQAERAWVIANALGTAPRVLDQDGNVLASAGPAPPMHPLVMASLNDFPDEHVDPDWYVVSKGRTPGVYPAWNIAAHETQGCKRSVYEKYPTRIAAQKAFADAMAAGMVSSISV